MKILKKALLFLPVIFVITVASTASVTTTTASVITTTASAVSNASVFVLFQADLRFCCNFFWNEVCKKSSVILLSFLDFLLILFNLKLLL